MIKFRPWYAGVNKNLPINKYGFARIKGLPPKIKLRRG